MPFASNLQQLSAVSPIGRDLFFKDRGSTDFWHLRTLAIGALILIFPHLGRAEQEVTNSFVCQSEQNSAAPVTPALQSLTLEQAVKRVTRQSGGKILSARRIQTRKGPMFRIKVLTRTGRVRVVQIAEFEPPSVPN